MRALLASLFTLACIVSTPANALSLGGVKSKMVDFLLEKVSVPGEFELSVESVEDAEEGGTLLNGVTIVDATGPWFRAERFELAWSPSRLIKGDVQIDRLHLIGGRLLRLPSAPSDKAAETAEENDASAEATWPRAPLTVLIQDIQIRDMAIADTVTPQPIAFDATGQLRDEGDEQSLSLTITRTDAVSGRIILNYLKRFDTDALTFKLEADEAPGGLVAAYAGLDDATPVRLRLDADGPPDAWRGTLDLDAANTLTASGAFEATWATRWGADVDLNLLTGDKLAEPIRLAIGERATLELRAEEDENQVVRLREATLNAASLQATLDGTYARASSEVDLAVNAIIDADGAKR
ncbi:MAG: hypothetical protein AAF493_29990, partial [Pseudomonadota bacterium]